MGIGGDRGVLAQWGTRLTCESEGYYAFDAPGAHPGIHPDNSDGGRRSSGIDAVGTGVPPKNIVALYQQRLTSSLI